MPAMALRLPFFLWMCATEAADDAQGRAASPWRPELTHRKGVHVPVVECLHGPGRGS